MSGATSVYRWSEEHSVGVAELDQQHRKLFDTMNDLDQAMQGEGNASINTILDRLIDYAIAHFSAEETLMERHGFPGLAEHRRERASFRQRIAVLVIDHRAGRAGVPVELLLFMRRWLDKHVLEMDQQYAPYLNARGVH